MPDLIHRKFGIKFALLRLIGSFCLSDSVVNHGSESGVDLGSSSVKDDVNPSPSASLPSSPYSESLSLLGGSLNGSQAFVCDHCGLTFAHRDDLEKHEVSHPVPNQVTGSLSIGSLSPETGVPPVSL